MNIPKELKSVMHLLQGNINARYSELTWHENVIKEGLLMTNIATSKNMVKILKREIEQHEEAYNGLKNFIKEMLVDA